MSAFVVVDTLNHARIRFLLVCLMSSSVCSSLLQSFLPRRFSISCLMGCWCELLSQRHLCAHVVDMCMQCGSSIFIASEASTHSHLIPIGLNYAYKQGQILFTKMLPVPLLASYLISLTLFIPQTYAVVSGWCMNMPKKIGIFTNCFAILHFVLFHSLSYSSSFLCSIGFFFSYLTSSNVYLQIFELV